MMSRRAGFFLYEYVVSLSITCLMGYLLFQCVTNFILHYRFLSNHVSTTIDIFAAQSCFSYDVRGSSSVKDAWFVMDQKTCVWRVGKNDHDVGWHYHDRKKMLTRTYGIYDEKNDLWRKKEKASIIGDVHCCFFDYEKRGDGSLRSITLAIQKKPGDLLIKTCAAPRCTTMCPETQRMIIE